MNAVVDSLKNMLDTVMRWLPSLIGALLVLLIGYIVAKAVAGIVRSALRKVGFDGMLHRSMGGSYIERVIDRPSGLLGSIVFWLLWLGAISLGVTVLGIPALNGFIAAIYAYLPNIFAALLIFLVAGAISGAAAAFALKLLGDTPTGKLVAAVVPTLTMLIAVFMILNQLQIAPAIVTITYAALLGSVGLGMALAFGLGGRQVAADLLEQAVEHGRAASSQAKHDVRLGRRRGRDMVEGADNTLEA